MGIDVALFTAIVFVIDLPLSFYQGFVRQHAYGMSNQSFGKWIGNALKRQAVDSTIGFLFAWVPFLLLARRPKFWWLDTTLLTVPFLFGVVLLKPIWFDPLFNDFGAMKDKAIEQKLLALAERARIGGSRIYEVNKSADTKAINAYVTGVLGTKRIVLWDTLLAKLDSDQVLSVTGHEMGHYVLGHVPRSILLSTGLTLLGLFWVDRAGRALLARHGQRFGFDRLSDVASVPLILLLMNVSALALAPVANAYSRFQEHEADCFAAGAHPRQSLVCPCGSRPSTRKSRSSAAGTRLQTLEVDSSLRRRAHRVQQRLPSLARRASTPIRRLVQALTVEFAMRRRRDQPVAAQ